MSCSSASSNLAKADPVSVNEMTWPTGVETFRTDIANALSLSENHRFAIIICEFKNIDATDAIIKVPASIGQKSLDVRVKNLNMAPVKEIVAATLRTVSALYLPKR